MLLNSNHCKVIKIAISSPYNFLCSILLHHRLCLNQRHQPTSKQQSATHHQEREKKNMLQLICLRKKICVFICFTCCVQRGLFIIIFFSEIGFTHVYAAPNPIEHQVFNVRDHSKMKKKKCE